VNGSTASHSSCKISDASWRWVPAPFRIPRISTRARRVDARRHFGGVESGAASQSDGQPQIPGPCTTADGLLPLPNPAAANEVLPFSGSKSAFRAARRTEIRAVRLSALRAARRTEIRAARLSAQRAARRIASRAARRSAPWAEMDAAPTASGGWSLIVDQELS